MESLYLTNLFIKIAKNRTEKQGKVSFLFKILLFFLKITPKKAKNSRMMLLF